MVKMEAPMDELKIMAMGGSSTKNNRGTFDHHHHVTDEEKERVEKLLESQHERIGQLRRALGNHAITTLAPGRWYKCDLCDEQGKFEPENIQHAEHCLLKEN
jgi:hypothetical protein